MLGFYRRELFLILAAITASLCLQKRDEENHLQVTTIEEEPYLQLEDSDFVGFIPDLIEEISDRTKRVYRFHLVADNKYGTKDRYGNWDGMIGEVKDKIADLAAAPMTISEERRNAVDFTVPFMQVGLSVLYKTGSDGKPFKSLEEFADNTNMRYGLVKNGSTQQFFESSQNNSVRKMWQRMTQNPDDLMDHNEAGVKKLKQSTGNYAFIMENTTAEYYMNQDCDLHTLHIPTDKQYGFAVSKGSRYLKELNDVITALKQEGVIHKLKQKWWKGKCGGGGESDGAQKAVTSSMCVVLMLLFSKWCSLL